MITTKYFLHRACWGPMLGQTGPQTPEGRKWASPAEMKIIRWKWFQENQDDENTEVHQNQSEFCQILRGVYSGKSSFLLGFGTHILQCRIYIDGAGTKFVLVPNCFLYTPCAKLVPVLNWLLLHSWCQIGSGAKLTLFTLGAKLTLLHPWCQIGSGAKLTHLHSWSQVGSGAKLTLLYSQCQIGLVPNWLQCQIGAGAKWSFNHIIYHENMQNTQI